MPYSRRERFGYWLERRVAPRSILGHLIYYLDGITPDGRVHFVNRVNHHSVLVP